MFSTLQKDLFKKDKMPPSGGEKKSYSWLVCKYPSDTHNEWIAKCFSSFKFFFSPCSPLKNKKKLHEDSRDEVIFKDFFSMS